MSDAVGVQSVALNAAAQARDAGAERRNRDVIGNDPRGDDFTARVDFEAHRYVRSAAVGMALVETLCDERL
ncbi:MAG TPA: hypothetical protein VGL13_10315 [Polyangiaceae bacterium]